MTFTKHILKYFAILTLGFVVFSFGIEYTYAQSVPTVTSPTSVVVSGTSAILGATVTSDGGSPITARGTCWGTSPTPTTNCAIEGGTAVGRFSHLRVGLPAGTLIYFRGFAINAVGEGSTPAPAAQAPESSGNANSAPATYTLMAPMGSILSGSPDLATYLQGAVTVIIGVAGLLAMIMTVYCGVRLMVSQSASGKSEAKECIWNALFGLLLAIGAWILLYTINPLLLSRELNLTDVAVAPPASTGGAIPQGNYRWSGGTSCAPVTGQIVAVVPPSYCSGNAPSPDSACCGYVDSPLRPRAGTPVAPVDPGTTPGETTPPVETTVTFSASSFTVNESAGSITMTVSRSSGVGAGSIDYFTSSAGATPGEDYRETSGTLLFQDGVTSRTFIIPITNDTTAESGENITVALSNPSGALGVGSIGSVVIMIADNDPPTTLDTIYPRVTITSPPSGLATTSSVISVAFTASDNQSIRRIEYTYTPPSPAIPGTTIICNTDCASPSASMTVTIPISPTMPGTHYIAVNACDSRQCYSRQIALIVEAPCVPSNIMNCKVLPTGDTATPWCTPEDGTRGISVLGENVLSEAWCIPDWYDPVTDATTTGQCFPEAWVNAPKVDAYAFKITSADGGGNVYIAGGSQAEWPPRLWVEDSSCNGSDDCEIVSELGWCTQNIVPNNLIVSISSTPGDMTSRPTTSFTQSGRVSGYCGSGNAVNIDRFAVNISTTASGAGICRVERDRTYYLNVTTIPFLAGGNALYTLFWDFLP